MVLENLFNWKLASPDLKYESSFTDNKKEMKVYAPQTSTQTTSTYNPVFSPVDNRSLTLVLNSSDVSTKKADKVQGAISSPEIGASQTPTSSFIPDFGTSNPSTSQSQSETSQATTWLLIGVAVVVAIVGIKAVSGGKK